MTTYGKPLTTAEAAEFKEAIESMDNLEIKTEPDYKPENLPELNYKPESENQGELF